MFKIFVLNPDFPGAIEALQQTADILSINVLGFDREYKYILVQYGNKLDPPPPPPDSV